ncbi:response regulator transcription factor [Cumulibacter soli]|uniref:response regulator transcription factor n=1 Tax=Cumulibacter soli TaxID=2546344 RepID=UPI001FB8F1F9|nr:response regulator transcription factor [Cumulibacter soli]
MNSETRVVLVDDDALVRMGLRAMLDGLDGIRIVAEAADGDEVPAAVARHRPHVILMDLRMKRVDGITATGRLQGTAEVPAVIVLTTFDDKELVTRAIRAGAIGFLLKHAPPEDIVRAIVSARRGESLLSPEIASQLVTLVANSTHDLSEQSTARHRLEHLSARELQVARAVAQGKSNAEIAIDLSLTVPTIKSYISTILSKTAAENRVQLAVLIHTAKIPIR